jgi:hypothetical protein
VVCVRPTQQWPRIGHILMARGRTPPMSRSPRPSVPAS